AFVVLPAVAVVVGGVRLEPAVVVGVVLGGVDQTVLVAVVPDEVRPAVVVHVGQYVDTAVVVRLDGVGVPMAVAVDVDVGVVTVGHLMLLECPNQLRTTLLPGRPGGLPGTCHGRVQSRGRRPCAGSTTVGSTTVRSIHPSPSTSAM